MSESIASRSVSVRAFGDTADEIELCALDEARRVFGPDIPLEIMRNYLISRIEDGSPWVPKAGGKTYTASVSVYERDDRA